MGQTEWNKEAALELCRQLADAGYEFDIILTAEAKAVALAQELSDCLGHPRYVVLRKSPKLYMRKPIVVVDVLSITTRAPQNFYLGNDQTALLEGKRVCVLDDVISTGGTMRAILRVARQVGFTVPVIATVLTEGEPLNGAFEGIPVVSLGHIPLPATREYA